MRSRQELAEAAGINRRAFAKAALAAPLLAGLPAAARGQPKLSDEPYSPSGDYVPWLEARADALRHNAAVISAATGGRKIVAVVKTDGYGLGDEAVAKAFELAPSVWGFMVVRPSDAIRLADSGLKKPLLLMGARVSSDTAMALAKRGVRLSLNALDEVTMLEPIARALGRRIPVHLEIDTGYGRMGALHTKIPEWARILVAAGHIEVEGVSTYYVGDDAITAAQIERFTTALDVLKAVGLRPSVIHAPHSSPILTRPQTLQGCNATRPGLILYGVYPNARLREASTLDLQVAHRLMTRVMRVEKLPQDHGSIAGLPIDLTEPRYFATIGIGVHDGLRYDPPKGATKRVEIRGRLYDATEGRNYNHMMIDLGVGEPDVSVGDVVKIFSWERPELHPNADVDTAYWQAFYGPDIRRVML